MNRSSNWPLRDEPQLRENYFGIYSPQVRSKNPFDGYLGRSDHSCATQNSAAPDVLGGGTLPSGGFKKHLA